MFVSVLYVLFVFFFKQKTAYDMRISDWSSDVCSSDLLDGNVEAAGRLVHEYEARLGHQVARDLQALLHAAREVFRPVVDAAEVELHLGQPVLRLVPDGTVVAGGAGPGAHAALGPVAPPQAPAPPRGLGSPPPPPAPTGRERAATYPTHTQHAPHLIPLH